MTFMSDKNTDVNKFRETINYLVSLKNNDFYER